MGRSSALSRVRRRWMPREPAGRMPAPQGRQARCLSAIDLPGGFGLKGNGGKGRFVVVSYSKVSGPGDTAARSDNRGCPGQSVRNPGRRHGRAGTHRGGQLHLAGVAAIHGVADRPRILQAKLSGPCRQDAPSRRPGQRRRGHWGASRRILAQPPTDGGNACP